MPVRTGFITRGQISRCAQYVSQILPEGNIISSERQIANQIIGKDTNPRTVKEMLINSKKNSKIKCKRLLETG